MSDKQVSSLVGGLSRRLFENDADMTDEFLKEQLFTDNADAFEPLVAQIIPILEHAAAEDMDLQKLESYLSDKVTKKEIPESVAVAVQKLWKKDRVKIHDNLVKKTSWEDKFGGMSWRLDVLTKSRFIEELGDPAGIVEIKIEKADNAGNDVCRFEMDAKELDKVVAEVEKVEEFIASLT
eukprot:m.84021 g.84021  ORF g.84021 m.84021 type:complete len:180 (-) comp12951_c0_seq2:2303-2842(-)